MRDPLQTYIRRCLVADDALREEEHAQNDTHGKNDGHNYRQAIEVLLHDARGELELYSELAIISETPVPLPNAPERESSAPRQKQPKRQTEESGTDP